MTKQDERTPGPWHQDGFFIQDDNGHLIAIVESPDGRCDEANARFIVQACNAYTSTEALTSPDRNFENAREAWNLVWEREAEISTLKASTEALREAIRRQNKC